jgi:hypothetical protein
MKKDGIINLEIPNLFMIYRKQILIIEESFMTYNL